MRKEEELIRNLNNALNKYCETKLCEQCILNEKLCHSFCSLIDELENKIH